MTVTEFNCFNFPLTSPSWKLANATKEVRALLRKTNKDKRFFHNTEVLLYPKEGSVCYVRDAINAVYLVLMIT